MYESLQKSKTEQELKISLNNELSQLQDNITSNWNSWFSWNNWNEIIWNNPWWYENLSSAENKEKQQVSEQYIYKQAKLYWVTDNRQIAYILATVKWECWFKNIKESVSSPEPTKAVINAQAPGKGTTDILFTRASFIR